MQPSLSIVLFTTSTGAGLGLLFLLGLGAPLGLVPQNSLFGLVGLLVAFALTAGGLFSSSAHLGRPERAWRAVSQWRSSWLSREGLLAIATVFPALVFGIGWVLFGATGGVIGLFGVLAAALAAATVVATGMIYASLKPIHQWHNGWVVPVYLLLALMAGWLLLDLLARLWAPAPGTAAMALVLTLLAWAVKEGYWRYIATTSARSTVASATGLGRRGKVRLLESPHTQDNYLLREMGFRIARKHARRLRLVARLAGFLVPAILSLLALLAGGLLGAVAAGLAVASGGLGLFVERWLFFAEAKHTVILYYGSEAA